jgi:putative redox protein
MGHESEPRRVDVERVGPSRFSLVNSRGARISIGTADGDDFTPVELLLGAIGGCSAIDVDILTTRRSEPTSFSATVTGRKIRNDDGNQLDDIELTFRVAFPPGAAGDAARDVLPKAVQRSHDQLCTVSRTVELGAEVAVVIAET